MEGGEEVNNQEVERYFDEYILPPKGFIYNDIEREIDLARMGMDSGNFLSALALLCYTDFMGLILLRGKGNIEQRFNSFIDLMGDSYKQLRKRINIYKDFRCGMVHNYFIRRCIVVMLNKGNSSGIVEITNGQYAFIVEKYFEDFMNACHQLYSQMAEEQNPYLPST